MKSPCVSIAEIRARHPELVAEIDALLAERGIGSDGQWKDGVILCFNESTLIEFVRSRRTPAT